ncbi:MAG TPA: (d)CMP kinase [Verrucomicrobiae bacterium]|jgi:cytidylate kinase
MELEHGKTHVVVAIDGPGASGKSSTARALAKALGFLYVDTGAMYRTLAWHCLRKKVSLDNPRAIASACQRWKTALENVGGQVRLLVDGNDPGDEIRAQEVGAAASKVAVVPAVRRWMRRTQRDCRRFGNLVMEGRDIGTNVFPETDFKFFLDAPLEERARRRAAEGVSENLRERDHRDSQRAAAPLMVPLGAKVIDNTGLTVEQTAALIVAEVKRREAAAR